MLLYRKCSLSLSLSLQGALGAKLCRRICPTGGKGASLPYPCSNQSLPVGCLALLNKTKSGNPSHPEAHLPIKITNMSCWRQHPQPLEDGYTCPVAHRDHLTIIPRSWIFTHFSSCPFLSRVLGEGVGEGGPGCFTPPARGPILEMPAGDGIWINSVFPAHPHSPDGYTSQKQRAAPTQTTSLAEDTHHTLDHEGTHCSSHGDIFTKKKGHSLSFAANFHFKHPSVVKSYSVKYRGLIELESRKGTSWSSFSLTAWIPSFPWCGSLSWILNYLRSGQSHLQEAILIVGKFSPSRWSKSAPSNSFIWSGSSLHRIWW